MSLMEQRRKPVHVGFDVRILEDEDVRGGSFRADGARSNESFAPVLVDDFYLSFETRRYVVD